MKYLYATLIALILVPAAVFAGTFTQTITLVSVVEPEAPIYGLSVESCEGAEVDALDSCCVSFIRTADKMRASLNIVQLNDARWEGQVSLRVDVSGTGRIAETDSAKMIVAKDYSGFAAAQVVDTFTVESTDALTYVRLSYTFN